MATSQDYYTGSEENFGEYQYIKLDEIITNYMISRTTDDYTSSIPRFQILYQAKRGMRELYYDVVKEIEKIELDLSSTLQVVLPPDYIRFVRISWVDENGHLHPMAIDSSMNMAERYLQDNSFNYIFDANGAITTEMGTRENPAYTDVVNEDCGISDFNPNLNTSKLFTNGKYSINKDAGIIQFGQDVRGKSIVLEYISDGLYTGTEGKPEDKIRIHKFAEEALLNYIYWSLIKQMRNVPANEKQRAKKEFYNMRRVAKRRINIITLENLIQVFKGDSKWIKGE